MKLTPIKIRGRGRKQPWQPPNPERFKRKHHDEGDEHGEETGVVPSQVDKNGVKRRRRVKTRKPAALIEQLPPEILERIFSMSENLNFPRSSLRIGYMLSARTFLLQLIVDAFSHTWDLWFGCPRKDVISYRGYEKDGERMGGNAEFQTSIISSKWFTFSLLLHAQQVWIRRQQQNGLSRPFIHTENWLMIGPTRVELDHDLLIAGEDSGLNQQNYPHHPHHRLHFGGDWFSDTDADSPDPPSSSQSNKLDVEACFEADWSWFTTILPQFDPFGIYYGLENREKRTGYWDINPDTKIPNHLLANPVRQGWESVKFLYWLVRGGATLGGEQTWELTKLGYERLMSHPDHPPSSSHNPSQQHDHSQEERELQSLTCLRLFSILGIFDSSHWPHFLITEKLEQISAERKRRRRLLSSQLQSQSQSQSQHSSQGSQAGYELWKCAQGVLRYWVQQRDEEGEQH
ncbi:hypothetical protein B0T20DRAFT_91866 [Sordaria brevicollis]|uniref:F-box domain-containing protein n=1 Tax=Sordaria brevicollis TaxID=83679 RepID=A0AAE0U2X5_SORBR|nr:hypothetical protein B0T20DRAFT_91866 [Sordaria brevicollis]